MSAAAKVGSAVDGTKIIPQDELNVIMRKLEELHSKLYTPASTWKIFMKSVMGKGKKGEAGGVQSFAEAGVKWRSMSAAEKQPYEAMRTDDKASADAARDKYNEYMQTVGPRLFDHDEEMEKIQIKRAKDEQQKRFDDQKRREQRAREDQKKERKLALRASYKRKAAQAAPVYRGRPVAQDMTQLSEDNDEDYEAPARTRSTRVPATPRVAQAPKADLFQWQQHSSRTLAQAPRSAPQRRSGNQKEDLMNGLDPNIWEIRESRHKPGVFYYFNKQDRISVAAPQFVPQQDAKSQILESHRQLKQQASRTPATAMMALPSKQAPRSAPTTKQTAAPPATSNKRLNSKQPGGSKAKAIRSSQTSSGKQPTRARHAK